MKVLANMEHMQYHLPYQSYPKRLVNQIEIPVIMLTRSGTNYVLN